MGPREYDVKPLRVGQLLRQAALEGVAPALAFAISFLVGWASVRWLLHFVSNHTFRIFAWYRLAFGVVILLILNGV